jgi:hypothetical protein
VCRHNDGNSLYCNLICNCQTKQDGSHPGYSHNCELHGTHPAWT